MEVITEGPIQIMMLNAHATTHGPDAPEYVSKPKHAWTSEDKTRNTLDIIANDILFQIVDETLFPRIRKW